MLPRKVGQYRLKRFLGNGQSAEVYSARRRGWWRRKGRELVAIKLLHEYHGDQEKRKFLQEAKITLTLDHPGIVKIIEVNFRKKTQPYIVMTYAPGDSLRKKHPSGIPLPLETIRSYTNQLADALTYAHQHEVVHCDVKPENIFVGESGRLLLGDFGIARIREATLAQTTGDSFGTPTYMAPEQFRGKYSEATDQYALAIMVYEWLCGKPPFTGENLLQLMDRHMLMPVPPLLEACKIRSEEEKISKEVEQVILRALAKEPHDRFPSIHEFAQALEEVLPTPRRIVQSQPALALAVPSSSAKWVRYFLFTLLGVVYLLIPPTVAGLFLNSWWVFGGSLAVFVLVVFGAVRLAIARSDILWAVASTILSAVWAITGWIFGGLFDVTGVGDFSFQLGGFIIPGNGFTALCAGLTFIITLAIHMGILSELAYGD